MYYSNGVYLSSFSALSRRAGHYGMLASSALLWFDFVLTFPTEVRHIWKRKISGATLVYFAIRYTAIIDRVLNVTQEILSNSGTYTCNVIQRVDNVILTLNYLGFSAFTILGVYGVWGPSWKPLLAVVPLTLIKPALYVYISTQIYSVQAGGPALVNDSCRGYYTSIESPVIVALGLTTMTCTSIASNLVLIVLTWIKTFGIYKTLSKVGMQTPLTTLLIHDGTIYFIILFLSHIATTVVYLYPSVDTDSSNFFQTLIFIWPDFNDVLSPIFLSRFLLDACSHSFTDHQSHMGIPGADSNGTFSPSEMSEIRFNASRIVGKLNLSMARPDGDMDTPPDVEWWSATHTHELKREDTGHSEPRDL